MRNTILAVVAVIVLAGFALAVGGAAAHGSDEADTSHDSPENESANGWTDWMEQHMIDHMGEERAAQMEARMPMTYEEMGQHMASHDHDDSDGGMMGGMSGMGCH